MNILNKTELTKQQTAHLRTVEWLLSDDHEDIATGRSTVLAVAYINKALEYPGRRIRVVDHFPAEQASRQLLSMIVDTVKRERDEKLLARLEVYGNSLEFCFKPREQYLETGG